MTLPLTSHSGLGVAATGAAVGDAVGELVGELVGEAVGGSKLKDLFCHGNS